MKLPRVPLVVVMLALAALCIVVCAVIALRDMRG